MFLKLILALTYIVYCIFILTYSFILYSSNFNYHSKLMYYFILSLILNTYSVIWLYNYYCDYNKVKYNPKNKKNLNHTMLILLVSNMILFLFGTNEIIVNILEFKIYRDVVYINLCFQLIIIILVSLISLLEFNKYYIDKNYLDNSKYYV